MSKVRSVDDDVWNRYTPASRRLVEALFEGRDPAPEDVATVEVTLSMYLGGLGLHADLRQDIVQETFLLLVSGVRRGIVDREGNLAAFVRTIALNCFRDAGRYRARRPAVSGETFPEPMTDDGVSRLLDVLSTAGAVKAAMSAAAADGKNDLVTFISDWLTFAELLGTTPSLREAADALNTNHMHVKRELERFARYLHRQREAG